jgi:hypothetical protein
MSMIPFLDIIDSSYVNLILSAIKTLDLSNKNINSSLYKILDRGFFYFDMMNGLEFERNGVKYLIHYENNEIKSISISTNGESVSI